MTRMFRFVERLVLRDEGQDLLEYGLLVVLIAVAALAGVSSVANVIDGVLWRAIAQNL